MALGSRPQFSLCAVATSLIPENDLPYTLGDQLGTGAHSVVVKGTHKESGEEVAVKVISKAKLSNKSLLHLKREYDIHSRLDHPHIVKLKGVYETKDKVFMIMELMSGGELFERLMTRRTFPESEAAALLRSLAMTVDYLHAQGIAHRDLKPENVLFSSPNEDAVVKIGDFGLANHENEEGDLKTPCGTPGYLAPELASLHTYQKSVDCWSLGVILYILLCGFPPFYDEDVKKLLSQVKKGSYKFPSPFWDDVSESAKDLVSKLLTVDPAARYSASQTLEHPWLQPPERKKLAIPGYTDTELCSPSAVREFMSSPTQRPDYRNAVAVALEAQLEPNADEGSGTREASPALPSSATSGTPLLDSGDGGMRAFPPVLHTDEVTPMS